MAQQQVPIGQQPYYEPAVAMAQASGVIPGQPTQQTFQNPAQQMPPPASTIQAMQQQAQPQYQQVPIQPQVIYQPIPPQGITISQDDFNKQVEELAENKYKIRAQEVINNAVAAMKGVANMFNQQPQQQCPQQQQPSFWDTTTGKVTIGGIGGAIGVGGCKLISHFFGGNSRSGGYSPSPAEMSLVGDALKALFSR